MQFHIFIQNPAENHFTATVFGMPDWAATGTTESEALAKVESLLDEKLANGKIVTIEVPEIKREREIEDLI
jgi:predicted RNase H-like HicB family nuclease